MAATVADDNASVIVAVTDADAAVGNATVDAAGKDGPRCSAYDSVYSQESRRKEGLQ